MQKFKEWWMPIALAVLIGITVYDRLGLRTIDVTPPVVATDPASLGRAYGPKVVATLADGWIAAADALAGGKTVAEAQSVLQDRWKSSRTEIFMVSVAPEMRKILTEGTEPENDDARADLVAFWRAFARGLKGGR